jgi:hypothetical protein
MLELGHLIKSFFLAILVVMGLQYKIENRTIESRIMSWMHHSEFVGLLTDVANGGVVLIQDTARLSKQYLLDTFGSSPETERAKR